VLDGSTAQQGEEGIGWLDGLTAGGGVWMAQWLDKGGVGWMGRGEERVSTKQKRMAICPLTLPARDTRKTNMAT
jgi:hypothetical protein